MNVNELKKMIYAFLKTKTDNVFDGRVRPDTAYPYVTFTLSDSYTDSNMVMEQFWVYIDIFDNDPLDTKDLEELTGDIDGDGDITAATGFHRKHHFVENVLAADFYRDARLDIEDEDPKIRRRQLRYLVMTYLS